MTAPTTSTTPPDPRRLMEVLQFVAELGQVVASNTEMQPILDWMVTRTTAMLGADEGCIRLSDPGAQRAGGHTVVRIHKKDGTSSGSWPREVAVSVEGFLALGGDHIASADLRDDPRFGGLRDVESKVRAILAVPLKVENRVTGVLAVTESAPGRQWNESEVQLLSIVAGNSAGVIEQARLRVEAMERKRLAEERERMERELSTARDIQMSFVPARSLAAGPWEVLGKVVPARQVGGDAFDYFMLEGGKLGFAIADVSGKGVPAALLMSSVQASLRAFCDGRQPVADAVRLINQSVARNANGKFITFFYGELDSATGRLRYTNAGHNYPIVRRRGGDTLLLEEGGMPLGLFESADYAEGETTLEPGDALLLYSDGVTEAIDFRNQDFGEERLLKLWKSLGGRSAADALERILEDVQSFRGTAPPTDDITVVVLSAREAG